jgi:monovalent cation:H+ antiporter-2, CPA2 family
VLEGSLMLASHALVLLDVPLNRVVKRIRQFREARYKMFKGFFRGISDAEDEVAIDRQERLYSVEITQNSFAHGRALANIPFFDFGVEVKQMRRPNMLEPINPRPDMVLTDGDVLVLLGNSKSLVAAEVYLVSGK